MHSSEPRLRDVYYGSDHDNLYLRLDLDSDFELRALELHADGKTIALLNNPLVQFVKQRIVEIRVPLALAGSQADYGLAVNGQLLPARISIEHLV